MGHRLTPRFSAYGIDMSETMTGRLNVQVTQETELTLQRAAALSGHTLSSFVLASAIERAHAILQRETSIAISDRAFRAFVDAIEAPAQASPEIALLLNRPTRIPTD